MPSRFELLSLFTAEKPMALFKLLRQPYARWRLSIFLFDAGYRLCFTPQRPRASAAATSEPRRDGVRHDYKVAHAL